MNQLSTSFLSVRRNRVKNFLLALLLALPVCGHATTAAAQFVEVPLSGAEQKRLGAILGFLKAFYAARGDTPAWADPKDVQTALTVIAEAEADGLDPEDFAFTKLQAMAQQGHSRELDIQLTANIALLGYVLRNGKTDPNDLLLSGFWERVSKSDPAFDLNYAIEGGILREVIGRLRPQFAYYGQLQRALTDLNAVSARGGWPQVSEGPTLRLGDRGPRVAEVIQRLASGGYMATIAMVGADPGDVFDEGVQQAVRDFQIAHGEDPDGIVGSKTIAAMNVSVLDRIDQLRGNLERARWIGELRDERHIIVNIAGYYAAVIEDGRPVWTTRVIVGDEYTRTPVFLDEIEYLEFNPTWTAPRSIIQNELAPKIIADPRYLERNDYYLAEANGRRVSPSSVDFSTLTPRNFRYWVVQEPGDKNALGRVKFMFPNAHSVYMHDTPSRQLFDKTKRTFSHGCIRTENPLELAELLLSDQGWDAARIQSVLASGQRTRVPLETSVPVAVLYWTADPTPSGVRFYPDIYGRDAAVLEALNTPLQLSDR